MTPNTQDCRSVDGETVGLIDAAIIALRIASRRDLTARGVRDALQSLRADAEVARVLRGPAVGGFDEHGIESLAQLWASISAGPLVEHRAVMLWDALEAHRALQRECETLRAALVPFAAMHREGRDPQEFSCAFGMTVIRAGDFEVASRVLGARP